MFHYQTQKELNKICVEHSLKVPNVKSHSIGVYFLSNSTISAVVLDSTCRVVSMKSLGKIVLAGADVRLCVTDDLWERRNERARWQTAYFNLLCIDP